MTTKLNNVASERAVLAGIANYGSDAFLDICDLISKDSFTVEYNQVFYSCASKALEQGMIIDLSSILSCASTCGLSDFVGKKDCLKHFNGILHTPVDIDDVRNHAKVLKRLEFARKLQHEMRDIYKSIDEVTGEESLNQIMSLIEDPIQKISLSFIKEDESTPKLIGHNISEYIQHLIDNPCDQVGISSGFPAYDKAIGGGFRRKCVDLFGGRPKQGKSTIADNIALNVSTRGIPVLMLDTEMGADDHQNRLLANLSEVEINRISTGKFASTEEELNKVKTAGQTISNCQYFYRNISGMPFGETLSVIRRWIMKEVGFDENGRTNDCLVIYDYLKLMTSDSISSNLAEFQVLGFQITSLHNLAVEYDFPCVSFVQLNRDGITKDTTDVVSGSDRLVWLCTSFSLFKEKSTEEIAADGVRNGNRKLIPIVSRHGPGMEDNGYICLNMRGSIAKVEEIGTIREIKQRPENRRDFPDNDSEAEANDENF